MLSPVWERQVSLLRRFLPDLGSERNSTDLGFSGGTLISRQPLQSSESLEDSLLRERTWALVT